MKLLKLFILSLLIIYSIYTYSQESISRSVSKPPSTNTNMQTTFLNNDTLNDKYAWLKDKTNSEVIKHLEAENEYTDAMMLPTVAFQETLYNEMLSRIKETDLDVPYRIGNYFYYTRTEKGKQYSIFCRKKNNLDAPEEIILDQNELAAKYQYFRLGAFSVSIDQNLLAFSIDTTGAEEFSLFVKNLETNEFLADKLDNVNSVVWALENQTIFYTTHDHAKRPHQLFRHTLGTTQKEDVLIYEEKDELFRISAWRSRSKEFIFLNAQSSNSDEVRYLSAGKPLGDFKIISPREQEHEYTIDHYGDKFYIVTNKGAKNFKLVVAPVSDPQQKNWKEVLPHRKSIHLTNVDFFKNYFVAYETELGIQKMRVTDLRTNEHHYINFPEPVYTAYPSTNAEFDTNVFRFSYQSFITPSSIYDYNFGTREQTLLKQTEVLGGYNPKLYKSERIYGKAKDGKEVPISIVYKIGFEKIGKSPLHLTGYGSYGYSSPVTFSSSRLSLLDRGVVYAIAHVRGGSELGRDWYDDGKLLKKKNTFTDFISVAEHLVKENYTTSNHLTIEGGSAGGLLMGAVTNMRPGLFKAVVAQVPFVDVINTMLDETLPLTVGEFLEWGNPKEKLYYDYMKTYCPYTNIESKKYPNILVKVGLNDPRVGYWEGAKWTAKLREMKTDNNVILLKTNMGSGHGGRSGRYERLKEIAFDYAYILSQSGIVK
ncbi:MAG: S9 family peptidase [Bacteroidota bacterium]|nr:S9 family peptidase [Bacteroidota bacterium]